MNVSVHCAGKLKKKEAVEIIDGGSNYVVALKVGFTNNGAELVQNSALFKCFPLDLVSYNLQKVVLTKWPVERIFLSINDVYMLFEPFTNIYNFIALTPDQWILLAIEFHSSFMLKYQLFMKINLHFVLHKIACFASLLCTGTATTYTLVLYSWEVGCSGNSSSSVNSIA